VTVISSFLSSWVPGKRIGFSGYAATLSRNKNNGTKQCLAISLRNKDYGLSAKRRAGYLK